MDYEPNTIPWPIGSFCIHDADAKRDDMLMVVIGFTRDRLVKTRYVDLTKPRNLWINEPRYLHDPARFGVVIPRKE